MGQQHKPRSKLSGAHPLARPQCNTSTHSALQILRDTFAPQPSSSTDISKAIADASDRSTLIVPRKGPHLPYHVVGTGYPQPWDLLPMRAAALKQYPNIFSETCLFFSSLQHAISQNKPQRLLPCTKVALDLAKLARNLGILASFEVIQKVDRCHQDDYMWPVDQEPQAFSDLRLYQHLFVKLNIRWDAFKPVWQAPSMSVLQEPLYSTDALPFSIRHLSKPSVPTIMTPKEIELLSRKLPVGIAVMYHDQLGLTVDAVTSHYGLPALALTHIALPWVQVAQIKAALQDKAQEEQHLSLSQTLPLTEWRLSDWVARSLERRSQQLASQSQHINRQCDAITQQVTALNKQDTDKAHRSLIAGQTLHKELMALTLMDKLKQAAEIAARTSDARDRVSSRQATAGSTSTAGPTLLGQTSTARSTPQSQSQTQVQSSQRQAGAGQGGAAAQGTRPARLFAGGSQSSPRTGTGTAAAGAGASPTSPSTSGKSAQSAPANASSGAQSTRVGTPASGAAANVAGSRAAKGYGPRLPPVGPSSPRHKPGPQTADGGSSPSVKADKADKPADK